MADKKGAGFWQTMISSIFHHFSAHKTPFYLPEYQPSFYLRCITLAMARQDKKKNVWKDERGEKKPEAALPSLLSCAYCTVAWNYHQCRLIKKYLCSLRHIVLDLLDQLYIFVTICKYVHILEKSKYLFEKWIFLRLFCTWHNFPSQQYCTHENRSLQLFVIFFGQVIISLKSSVHGRLVFVSVNGRQNVVTVLLHTHISLLQSYEIKSPPQAFRWMMVPL